MSRSELLGYNIYRRDDFKKVAYIGVVPLMDKKTRDEYMRVYPPNRFQWVEYRHISSPKTSKVKYRKW